MRSKTVRFLALVGVVVGALGIAACGDDKPGSQSTAMPGQQRMQEIEQQTAVAVLVEPGSGASSPWKLLQRMYGNIDGLCWEEVTFSRDADTEQIPLGFTDAESPPQELIDYLEAQDDSYDRYQYKWLSSMRLLLLRQELVDTESGRQGPLASAFEVFRSRGSDGHEFWQTGDAAAVYPCDY